MSKKEWEDFIEKHKAANFLHSWYWGEFHKNLGKTIKRTGFYEDKKITEQCCQLLKMQKEGKYLTVPGGPIIDWKNSSLVKSFVGEIKRLQY